MAPQDRPRRHLARENGRVSRRAADREVTVDVLHARNLLCGEEITRARERRKGHE
jgi:hypothetical protein